MRDRRRRFRDPHLDAVDRGKAREYLVGDGACQLLEQLEIAEDELILPHPQMLARAFVLVPLAEIAAEERLPDGITIAEALKACPDDHGVELDRDRPRLQWRLDA